MLKNKKIREIVITISMLCVVLVGIIIYFILSNKDESINDTHAYIVVGKVIDIRDDNVVLLEITRDRAKDYKVDDKILVKYEKSELYVTKDGVGDYEEYNLQLGDEIHIQNPSKVSKKDGYEFLEVYKVTKEESEKRY